MEEDRDQTDEHLDRVIKDLETNSFGVITQRGYRELLGMLETLATEIRRRFHRWFVIGLAAFAVIGVTSGLALYGFGLLLDKQKVLLVKQKATTSEIQTQRHNTILDNCQDQNDRHDLTSARLLRAAKHEEGLAKTVHARMRIHNSVEVSLGLIDSLAPKQDCNQVVRQALGKSKQR